MFKARLKLVAMVGLLAAAALAQAEEVEVGQKDKQFSVSELQLRIGDSVSFKNDDAFFHNIFSLSDPKSFDLGSYPEGESRSVTFENAGTVDVECAIHPGMAMTIVVAE